MRHYSYDECPSCGGPKRDVAKLCWSCWLQLWRGTRTERFWSRVEKLTQGDCWPFTGTILPNGYGQFEKKMAHRVAYILSTGPIPDGLLVLHRCDNPGCCNPAHLFVGTYQDNAVDMVQKGRAVDNSGQNNGMAKLMQIDIVEIRRQLADGKTRRQLAKEYGVTKDCIGAIDRGQRWTI